MRSPIACPQCRRAKRRCVRHKVTDACTPCQRRQLICKGKLQITPADNRAVAPRPAGARSPRPLAQHPEHQLGSAPAVDLTHGTAIELVEHYLDTFDGRPHSIFHPATLRARVRSGGLTTALLYAICAMGCRFSANPDTRALGPALATQSKGLLQADISNVCFENLQACILVSTMSVGIGDSTSEVLFFRIATAMAEIMRLNHPASEESMIDRETRCRVWWSLYLTDMWCIHGQGLQSQLRDIQTKPDLPMNDFTFKSLQLEQSAVNTPLGPGIWAQAMTLVQLFGPIHNINRLVADDEAHTVNRDQQVEELTVRLEEWKDKLPSDAQMNDGNLLRQQKSGLGGLLISVHLAYHHFSTLLYFRYLEVQRPTSPIELKYVARCKAHASSFSALLRQSRQLKGCDVLYPNIGHMATVSSSVLVHTLLCGDLNELEIARQELNTNFEALVELTQYWPATSVMIDRLTVFQDMCLLATESTAHKLDGWMLKFLIEHSLDVESTKTQVNPFSLRSNPAMASSRARELAGQGRYMDFHSL